MGWQCSLLTPYGSWSPHLTLQAPLSSPNCALSPTHAGVVWNSLTLRPREGRGAPSLAHQLLLPRDSRSGSRCHVLALPGQEVPSVDGAPEIPVVSHLVTAGFWHECTAPGNECAS